MPEPLVLTDATLNDALNEQKPLLILFTTGDGLRSDFKVAFNKAASDNQQFTFAQINPAKNPEAAARFGVGEKATLIGMVCGEEIVRRTRPWGTDLPLAFDMLKSAYSSRVPEAAQDKTVTKEEKQVTVAYDAPVVVTDATFEEEVLNSDVTVLVDFWAAWCGPCRMVAPILDKLAKEFAGQIKIAEVNVDENPGLSHAFRIMSIPNLMIVKERTIVFNQPGALPEATMRDLVQRAIALEVPKQPQEVADGAEQPESEETEQPAQ